MCLWHKTLYSSFEKLTPKVTKHQGGMVSPPLGSKDYIQEGELQTLKGQVSPILSFQISNRKIRAGEGLFPSEKLVPKLQ